MSKDIFITNAECLSIYLRIGSRNNILYNMYYKHNIRNNEENNLQQVLQMYTSMIRDVASEVSSSLCCLKRRSQQAISILY